MASSRITLEQVARLAGVSSSTVSRYLSGANPVTRDKAAAIDQATRQLNYRPNLVARGLATGRTMTVGVLTQEIVSSFFNEAMRGVEDGLASHRYEAVYSSGRWQADIEEHRLNAMIGRGVDGVVVIEPSMDDLTLERFAQVTPIVVVGRRMASARVPALLFDQFKGASLAMSHLLEQGHRRIAFIAGPPERPDAEDRLRAYASMLAEYRIPYDPHLVEPGNYVEAGGLKAMHALLERDPSFTAVFAANDDSAYGAMLALYQRGLRVPDDISIVGFDDINHSAFSLPPLTTVRQPLRQLGLGAANAIVALIEGRKLQRAPVKKLELIVRESTRALTRSKASTAKAVRKQV